MVGALGNHSNFQPPSKSNKKFKGKQADPKTNSMEITTAKKTVSQRFLVKKCQIIKSNFTNKDNRINHLDHRCIRGKKYNKKTKENTIEK